EGDSRYHPDQQPPLAPFELPPELAAFLAPYKLACVSHATSEGTAYVIKAPTREIVSVRGRVPIHLRHELYDHPAAPVVRTVLGIYDQPQSPLRLETFVNLDDAQQQADFAALVEQAELLLLFYDELLRHQLTKRVPHSGQDVIPAILAQAAA